MTARRWDERPAARRQFAREALDVVSRVRQLLAQERQARGLTWEQLAGQLGYAVPTVHGWVQRGAGISEASLTRILTWLATPPPPRTPRARR